MLRWLHPGDPQDSNSVLKNRFPVLRLVAVPCISDLETALDHASRLNRIAISSGLIPAVRSNGSLASLRKSHYSLDYAKNMRG